MPKAVWKGSISFGLVNIPVKVYSAVSGKGISFTMLCSKCGTPIKYKRWCPKCEREVPWNEIEKGVKISKDKYVVVEKGELERLKLKTTKAIEIVEFVDISQIDPILYQTSYYVVPEETGVKAYSLFVEALRVSGKVAIGRVVMKNKEYVVALRPYKKGIVMHVLHYLGEVREIEELEELRGLVTIREEELKLARALIEQLTSKELRLEAFKDSYAEAIRKLVKAKLEGKEVEVEREEEAELARDLMEALKASVEVTKKKKVVVE